MKGKTYFTIAGGVREMEPIEKNRVALRPWREDPKKPVGPRQVMYMWKSSIPRNWSAISDRPTRMIRGKYHRKRDTMEFLRETQRYIDYICKPIQGDEEILGIDPPGTSRSKRRSASPMGDTGKGKGERLEVLAGQVKTGQRTSSPVTCSTPTPFISRSRPQLPRQFALPSTRIEAGFYTPDSRTQREDYVVNTYMYPRSLIPTGKKPPRHHKRFGSMAMEEFLNRFEQKQEPGEALPVSKGLTGWKLTIGSRTMRARSQSNGLPRMMKLGTAPGSGNLSPSSQLADVWTPHPS